MTQKPLPKTHFLASRIALIYLVVAWVWIGFSDSLLSGMVADLDHFKYYSLFKGMAFVVLTAGLLYLLIHRTLQQQSRLERSLAVSEERWKFALEGAGEGVWDWDLESDMVFRSGQWHKIYGHAEDDVRPTATGGRELMHPSDRTRAEAEMNAYLQGETLSYASEYRLRCKDGSWKWTLSRGMIVSRAQDGRPLRVIGTHTDISERKRADAEIFRLAHYDKVTGLPNRVLFYDRLQQDIERVKRSGLALTLMFLDLDKFKEVNDTLGHDAGDQLLQEAARRLSSCVRASDTVARLGGDEFTVMLTNQGGPGSVEQVAQQVLHQLCQPFRLDDEDVYVSASIGITVAPDDASDAESLLKNADQAMYAAKAQGGNCFHFFTPSMQEASLQRMHITADLRVAIAEDQFELHYQPIVEMATGNVRKAEALIRWQHPERGMIAPSEFIPVAEDKGLIVGIGDIVFAKAVSQALQWKRLVPGFQISINKSPVQIKQAKSGSLDWLNHLQSLGLDGTAVVVEITESVLLEAQNAITSRLKKYQQAGMQIAIDDFGTGYSSLAYIKKFDISYVKIDRSFVKGLKPGADDLALCEAIIVMAHKLGMQVIAEGVETELQHALLMNAGCDYGQGYFYSKPLPESEFESLLLSGVTGRLQAC